MSESDVVIRAVRPEDHGAVLALARRLTEGVAAWRDPDAVRAAVKEWVQSSLATADAPSSTLFVADVDGGVVGFVSVGQRDHFAGAVDGYVGELVVDERHARQGIGGRLMERAEDWARRRGRQFLTLETGAANVAARDFYASRGYVEEDVRLTRPL